MGERDDAGPSIEAPRARITAVADELSRRMSGRYVKERVGFMARDRWYGAQERAADNAWIFPLMGAGVGLWAARAVIRGREDRFHHAREVPGRFTYSEEPYGHERRSAISGLRARGEEVKERLEERAAHVKEAVGERAEMAKERMGERLGSMREHLPSGLDLRQSASESPFFWALGALAVGALFGLALPVSQRERRILHAAKEKTRELGHEVAEEAKAFVGEPSPPGARPPEPPSYRH